MVGNSKNNADHPINAESWQPILLRTLVDELAAATDPVVYAFNKRGWRLLTVLSQCPWKNNEDYADLGDLKKGLLDPLSRLLTSLTTTTSQDSIISPNDWEHLLREGVSHRLPFTDGSYGSKASKNDRKKRPKRIEQVVRKRSTNSSGPLPSSSSSFDSTIRPAFRSKKLLSHKLNVSPYILHEDSDGFPLCWNEYAPIPSTLGSHLWLDDTILDLLYAQMPIRPETPSVVGSIAQLLCIIRQIIAVLRLDDKQRDVLPYLATILLSWEPVNEPRHTDRPLSSLSDPQVVLAGKKSVTLVRHWSATIEQCLVSLAERAALSRQGMTELVSGIKSMLSHAAEMMSLLSAFRSTEANLFAWWQVTEQWLGLIVDNTHRLIMGVLTIAGSGLAGADADHAVDGVQITAQMISVLSDCGFADCMRDLAICYDHAIGNGAQGPGGEGRHVDKLLNMLNGCGQLARQVQQCKTHWLHGSMCRRTTGHSERCQPQLDSLMPHHHGLLEFEARTEVQPFKHCCVAFMLTTIFASLRNMTTATAKRCALQSILSCPRCCCVPAQVLLTSLLADLADHKDDNQHLLIRCLGVHLVSAADASSPSSACSGGRSSLVSWGSSTVPLEYCCRICEQEGKVKSSEPSGYVSALSEYFSSASSSVLLHLCKLVRSILPGLDPAGKELLVANAVLPRLFEQCQASADDSHKTLNGDRRDQRLIVALLKIVAQGICGPKAYKSLIKHFFPFADCLFDCSLTQKPFVLCLERGVLLENSAEFAQKPLTRYVFDRFLIAMRTAKADVSTLIADSASRFHEVVAITLDLCHAFLQQKCSGFLTIFCDNGGLNECCLLIDACLDTLKHGSYGGGRASHRLTSLLSQTIQVSLLTDNAAVKTQVLAALEAVFCNGDEPMATNEQLANQICCTLIECSLIRAKEPVELQRIVQCDSDDENSSTQESEQSTVVSGGYNADDESPETITTGLPESKAAEELKHPELCIVAVKHLRQLLARESSGHGLDFATSNVCRLLQSICLLGDVNLQKLRQFDIVTHLHDLARSLVEKEMQSTAIHHVLTLLAGFVCSKPSSGDLELIVKLLAEPSGSPEIILETLLEMLTETSFEPAESLVFPQVASELLQKQKMSQSSPVGDAERVNRSLSNKRRRGTVDDIEAAGDVVHSLDSLQTPAIRRSSSSVLDSLGKFFSISSSMHNSSSHPKMKDGAATLPNPRRTARQAYLPPFGHNSAALLRLDRIGITLSDGVTIAFWSHFGRQARRTGNNVCLADWWHVATIGSEELSCSLYAHSEADYALLKISSRLEVVQEKRIKKAFPSDVWTHYVLSMIVENHDRLRIQMIVNGYVRHAWELGWSFEAPLRSPFSIGFGCLHDVQTATNFTHELSTILAFKGMISYQSSMILRGLGPRCRTLADTKARTLEPSLYCMLKPNLVANHSPEMISLLEDKDAFIEALQKSLLFFVVPTEAKTFGVYVLQTTPETISPADAISYLCLTRVKSFPIEWKCKMQSRQLASLDDAFISLGGCRLFVLLFARMIDMKTKERAQAAAFRLLFTAVRRHTEWWHEFVGINGNALVARCLSCPFAVVGQLMAFEIGQASISGLERTEKGELRATTLAVIRDPELLCSLVCRAPLWRGTEPFTYWVQLLEVLCSCVAETNNCGVFNRHQLIRVGFLKALLQACLEMFQDPLDYGPALVGSLVANSIVPLVAALLGVPEEVSRITELWDFLFLSHSASCTYLNYRIVGHNDWINLDRFQEDPINLLGRESELADQLRHYVHVLGREQVSHVLRVTNGSVAAVKLAYESALAGKAIAIANPSAAAVGRLDISLTSSSSSSDDSDDGGDESSRRSDSPIEQLVVHGAGADRPENAAPILEARDSFPRLPDLVCDIDANAAARDPSTTSGDSADEAWSRGASVEETAVIDEPTDDRRPPAIAESSWLVETRAGLLEVLAVVLQNGPDSVISRLIGNVVKWQPLIVMLNHQANEAVREACVRALCVLLLRGDYAVRVSFVKSKGFFLLANQLREYPCSSTIADSIFSLLCGEIVRLEDGLDATHLLEMPVDLFNCGAVEPIFALLENSLHDISIFWNLCSNLQKVFESNPLLAQAMLENRLVETLVNALQGVAFIEPKETDLYGTKDTGLMIDCWKSFANRVLHTCVAFSHSAHYQPCQDLIWLMQAADVQTAKSNNSVAHGVIRKQLCSLLHTWLESIRSLFSDEGLSASAVASVDSLHLSQTIHSPSGSGRSTPVPPDSRDGDASHVRSSSTTSLTSNITKPKNTGFLGGSFSNFREKFGALSGSQLSVKGRYKSRQSKLPSQSELTERLQFCLEACVDVFIHLEGVVLVSEEEEHLFEFYFYFLLSTAKKELSKDAPNRSQSHNAKNWHRLLWSCREKVRHLLARIVAFVLFPAEAKLRALPPLNHPSPNLSHTRPHSLIRRQLLVARGLSNEVQYKQMLRTLLDINLDYQYAMNLALHELIVLNQLDDAEEMGDVEKLLRFLKHLRIESPLVDLTPERLNALSIDEQLCLQTYQEQRQQFFSTLTTNLSRLISKQQTHARSISQAAMSVTCQVVEEQNVPRKLFIQVTKAAFAESLQAEETLIVLVSDLCHPYAACHDKRSWPASWCLDPTEGPNRERRRLMPSHISFDARFLLPSERAKLDRKLCPPPLDALLDRSLGEGNGIGEEVELAGQLIDRLRIDEKIALSMSAMILRSTFECSGEVLLGDRRIYFVGESSRSTQKGLPQKQLISMSWEYSEIVEVYKRHHQLLDTAVEVFFSNGETYLIVFDDIEKRDYFLHRLLTMDLTNLIMYPDNLLQAATRWWREGIITNFEYLTQLNKLAGRTFSDLMQYPVFPFILSDYTSTNLDLNNSAVYRNLAKPIAVQDKRMEDHYVINYKCLESEAKRTPAFASPLVVFGPYHYGSHYSNSGIVVHYLVRLPPFTDIALEYQDNSFDIPDRLFNSLETTWRLSSFESTTDFKELIPEFFFFPEFLVNFEGLNLGVRQAGQQVNDVILPNWCPNADPRLFVLVHRQALESQYVTAHLHHWIDLVFGYKQTGQAAIDAVNVFHPATYHGTHYDLDGKDDLTKSAIKTMVRTYGQMPKQLFKSPHLPHFVAKPHSFPPRNVVKGPLATVSGVRWGQFVGSPEVGEPVLVLKQRAANNPVWPAELSVVADGTCVALPQHCQILLKFRAAKREATPWKAKEIDCLGAVSWFFPDSVVRARILSPEPGGPWISVVALHDHKVTCSAFSIADSRLFLGLSSGVIRVFTLALTPSSIKSCRLEKELVGHGGAVTTISVCSEFSVVVTGCETGRLFLWDLNKLSFVRAFSSSVGPLTMSCVSKVSGDVGVVCQSGYGSRISLYSINGRLIEKTETDITVTSITMTNLPDGTAVNVLAVGMQNGIIRLFNVWTMALVREISHSSFLEPIVSLKFSNACKKLYAVTSTGTVLCWEGASTRQSAPPRFVFANPRL